MMLRNREFNKEDRQRESPEVAKRKSQNESSILDLESNYARLEQKEHTSPRYLLCGIVMRDDAKTIRGLENESGI